MRITKKILQRKINTINKLTNSPMEYTSQLPDGTLICNTGHFSLSCAYGAYGFERISSKDGAASCPLSVGHVPARELAGVLDGFIAGLSHPR
jgi:hypothetical protein